MEHLEPNEVTLGKYKSSINVSKGVFLAPDFPAKQRESLCPPLKENAKLVYDRLYDDFSRRMEAQKKLKLIVQKRDSAFSTNFEDESSEKRKRALSKKDINKMVDRLQSFWDNKWMKINRKRKEIADKEEEEFQSLKKKIGHAKSNSDIFNRLITPRSFKEPVKVEGKKFSIREAIESGKRLMTARSFKSPERISKSPKRIKDGLTINTEPSPIRKKGKYLKKENIDEIFSKCKRDSVLGQVKTPRASGLSISSTQQISYLPNRTKNN